MKKVITLFAWAFVLALGTNTVCAQQGGGNPEAMMARMKERMKPQLIEKAKLTETQADKVIEYQFEARQQMRGFRDMQQDERKKKMEEINAALAKKYKEIPLTDEQIKAVEAYMEEQRRNFSQRQNSQQ